ncbi:MAG: antitoxin VbhA family protein [Bacillota bacterium]|nr:antitoxin VbhA family protein [Bacillota bacterium]MDW7685242.1 antitoxin VbhA family protein [Bacillota bacterium]
MRAMSDKQIKRTFANVNKTLAVEGHQLTKRNRVYGRRFLRGEISSEEVISVITRDILDRKNKLEQ